jgi:3'(2'), 5'-bisphosphate nucleotidase
MSNWSDNALALEAAQRAARVLLALRQAGQLHGVALGDAGDRQANDAIVQLLSEQRPDDALLSEELAPDESRLLHRRVWIVDPLDGTREYRESGSRTDWAVHVALCVDGLPTACAVALPALGQVFGTDVAVTPAPRLRTPPPTRPRLLVSRTRAPAIARQVAARLGADVVAMGSAGAKAMAVLRGEAEIYLHAGGLNEWDSCAPVGVALAHRLHASRLDGSPCRYNQPDTSMPDLMVCRLEWLAPVRRALAGCV